MPILDGASYATFVVRLSKPAAEPVTVSWKTEAVTALPGEDYEEAEGELTFLPSETVKPVQILVYGRAEGDDEARTFRLALLPAANVVLGDAARELVITAVDEEDAVVGSTTFVSGEPGLSAYEVAKLQGFEGSATEWMDAITGPPAAAIAAAQAADAARIATDEVRVLTDTARVATDTTREETEAVKVAAQAVVDAGSSIITAKTDAVAAANAAKSLVRGSWRGRRVFLSTGEMPAQVSFGETSRTVKDKLTDGRKYVLGHDGVLDVPATPSSVTASIIGRTGHFRGRRVYTSAGRLLDRAVLYGRAIDNGLANGSRPFASLKGVPFDIEPPAATLAAAREYTDRFTTLIPFRGRRVYTSAGRLWGSMAGPVIGGRLYPAEGYVDSETQVLRNGMPSSLSDGSTSMLLAPLTSEYDEYLSGETATGGKPLTIGLATPAIIQSLSVVEAYAGYGQSQEEGSLPGGSDPWILNGAAAVDPSGTSLMLGTQPILPYTDVASVSAMTLQPLTDVVRQTYVPSLIRHLQNKLLAAAGRRLPIVMNTISLTGARMDQIGRGNRSYRLLLAYFTRLNAIVRASNKRLVVRGLTSLQGFAENNDSLYSATYYRDALLQFVRHINADIKAITGQTEDVLLFKTAPCSFVSTRPLTWVNNVALGVSLAAQADSRIVQVGPDYTAPLKLGADLVHPGVTGNVLLGEMLGESIYQTCYASVPGPRALTLEDGEEDKPWWQSGTELRQRINQPIAIDAGLAGGGALVDLSDLGVGKGIELVEGDFGTTGSPPTAVPLVSISVVANRILSITVPAGLSAPSYTLVVGMRRSSNNNHGPLGGPRTGIRSSASYGTTAAPSSQIQAQVGGGSGGQGLYHYLCPATRRVSRPN